MPIFLNRIRLFLAVLLLAALWGYPAFPAGPVKAAVVALALWSDQGVFLSEASRAARIASARYGHGAPVEVVSNSRRSFAAGPDGMQRAIQMAERKLDPDRDVLFLIMTSHGSPQGIAEKGGRTEGVLAPEGLASILRNVKVKQKVVVVSACFSGVFTALADPDTLVITAADATHPSFGCQAGATWTYFGDAFFNQALRRAQVSHEPLAQAFADAARIVRARELSQGFDPSNPQIAGGAHVLATLDGAP